MSNVLLAIDPSVKSIGVAVFQDDRLVHCTQIKPKAVKDESDGQRWVNAAMLVDNYMQDLVVNSCVEDFPNKIIFEKPQVYSFSKSKGNPNHLLGLAAIGAAIAALGRWNYGWDGVKVYSPTPAEWIGQIPKTTTGSAFKSPRAIRIMSHLDQVENKLVPDQHDVIDAVGLGLFALGRLERKKVLTSKRHLRAV